MKSIAWIAQSESDLPPHEAWLTPQERERAGRMRFAKRRTDYLLGRWTAKNALARSLGLEPGRLAELEIRNASDGAPQAFLGAGPAPLSLSLTDRAGWGVCALAAPGVAIGCDLELLEPRSAGFVRDFLTGREQARVAAAVDERERHLLANLVWSAKESALKVLRTGLRRDTRSVEVSLFDTSPCDGWHPLLVSDAAGGAAFPGWWRRFGVFLLTTAAACEMPPPACLVEPPALEGAAPSHRWLEAPLAGAGA